MSSHWILESVRLLLNHLGSLTSLIDAMNTYLKGIHDLHRLEVLTMKFWLFFWFILCQILLILTRGWYFEFELSICPLGTCFIFKKERNHLWIVLPNQSNIMANPDQNLALEFCGDWYQLAVMNVQLCFLSFADGSCASL